MKTYEQRLRPKKTRRTPFLQMHFQLLQPGLRPVEKVDEPNQPKTKRSQPEAVDPNRTRPN